MSATAVYSCLVGLMLAMFSCLGPAQTLVPGKSIISGEVTNASSGSPIPNARVVLEDVSGPARVVRVLKANPAGRFRLSGLEPATYLLKASRTGFLEYKGASFTLSAGQRLENFMVKLSPQSVITGMILQEDGDPYPGALVSAVPVDSAQSATYAYTNDLGEYRLFGLAPGLYYIYANHRGVRASTYYPHATDKKDAVPVEASPDALLTGIDLTAWASMTDAGARTTPSVVDNARQISSTGATMEGRIINLVTGAPVPRAHLSVDMSADNQGNPQREIVDTADDSGYFTLQNLPPGYYHLSASRMGFVAGKRGVQDLVLGADDSTKNVILELTPTGVITGKAVGEDGEPLANAVVMALSSAFNRGHREFFVARRVYTNDLGEYRLYDLPSGKYYVTALYHAGWTQEDSTQPNYPPVYYPNAARLTDATPLHVQPGNVLSGIDLALSNLTQVHVRGRAVLPSSLSPGSPISIYLTPADLSIARRYSRRGVDANTGTGEFELRAVPTGTYILAAEWTDEGTQYSATQTLNVGKTDVDGLVLRLHPERWLSGQVRLETKDNFSYLGLRVSLQTTGEGSFAYSGDGTVSQDGSFNIENLRPGRYSVSLSGLSANYYLKAVYYHGKNVTQSGVDVSQEDSGSLELVLSPDGGVIGGTVLSKDQESAPLAAVIVLVPETGLGEGRELYKAVTTDRAGKFSLKGIAPGRYTIIAADDLNSAQELITLNHLGEPVTIEENRTEKMDLNEEFGKWVSW